MGAQIRRHLHSVEVAGLFLCLALFVGCQTSTTDTAQNQPAPGDVVYRGNFQRTGEYHSSGLQQNGKLLWNYGFTRTIKSPPVVINDEAYVWSLDGFVHAVNVVSGKETRHLAANPAPRVIVAGVLYYSAADTLYAVDAKTQKQIWKYKTGGVIESSPAVMSSNVYFGSNDGYLYAVDATTGQAKWKLKAGDLVDSDPAYTGNIVYFRASHSVSTSRDTIEYSGEIYAVDGVNGKATWRFSSSHSLSDPVVAGEIVYCSVNASRYSDIDSSGVYALDAHSGKQLWKYTPQPNTGGFFTLAVANGTLYASSDRGKLYALDAKTGSEKWQLDLGGQVTATSIADGILYLGAGDVFYALDSKTGQQKWSFTIDGQILSAPFIAHGTAYFVDYDHLYALK